MTILTAIENALLLLESLGYRSGDVHDDLQEAAQPQLAEIHWSGEVIDMITETAILNAGFAIIHDKVLVIDPFADNCVVVTGSHNLGHKASYDNDENLVIVEGDKKLAVAYATHVLDVYDHFSWRYTVKRLGEKGAEQYLKNTPDEWLDKYFDAAGQIKNAQLKFWMQAVGP